MRRLGPDRRDGQGLSQMVHRMQGQGVSQIWDGHGAAQSMWGQSAAKRAQHSNHVLHRFHFRNRLLLVNMSSEERLVVLMTSVEPYGFGRAVLAVSKMLY